MIHKSIYSFQSLFVQINKEKVVEAFFSNCWSYIMIVARFSWELNQKPQVSCKGECTCFICGNSKWKVFNHSIWWFKILPNIFDVFCVQHTLLVFLIWLKWARASAIARLSHPDCDTFINKACFGSCSLNDKNFYDRLKWKER